MERIAVLGGGRMGAALVAGLLDAGLDEGTAGFVTALEHGTAAGDLDASTDDLERLLGRPATPLVAALRTLLG